MNTEALRIVKSSVNKIDGVRLVTGTAKYTDDFDMPDLLHAKILTSPHAHARIIAIDTERAKALDGVRAIITADDVTAIRHTKAGQSYPEPSPYDHVIFDRKVRFIGDRVALVVADSLKIAEYACTLIEVEYEILPSVFDTKRAMQCGAPRIHDEDDARGIYDASRNIASFSAIDLGNVEQGFREADVIVERTYSTQRTKHCALETHGSMGYLDENDRLVIISSTQVPFHTRRQLAYILDMPMTKIRVIKPRMGGGFGNKQGMFVEDLVAVAVLQTRRPVKIIFDRSEEFVCGYNRHPQTIRIKTGAKKDGTLIAQEMHVIGNTGAYGDHAPTIQECTGRKVLPLYSIPNIRFDVHAVYTNLPVSGAFRGYGAIQGFFATECQIDEIAAKLGMDPLEIRQKNRIRKDETDRIAAAFGDKEARVMYSCGLGECIERGAEAIGWWKKRGKSGTGVVKRGIGMACAMQASGIAGVDWGSATIKLNDDGTFGLFVGATDLGTGSDTVLTQIAAEALGVEVKDIYIIASDTDLTPFDVGAYASSTTYVSGGAVEKTAKLVKTDILNVAAEMLNESVEQLTYHPAGTLTASCCITNSQGEQRSLQEIAIYAMNQGTQQISETASNLSHTSPPPFTAQFAEVEVDIETGQVRVLEYVAAVDCGVAINPDLASGQVEGAVTQGIGYSLFEEMVFDEEGRLYNPNFADYKLPNAFDMPKLHTILVETYEASGPYGAKSVAEVPINGPAPAIANAIYDATGVRVTDLPFTAEKVLMALKKAKQ
ncbi:aldehyde oxidase [candidate division KSB3 bacterium]|uniref:Aldehyde oxidase n=1 Tax=candidate division KSB3 bacterium TaxID=2044937 RepID=A0A2G6KCV6_9BACT|nr:MAG: aldehyde oxidase [candidate division KSB3 bacterium]